MKRLSYIQDARCLKVNAAITRDIHVGKLPGTVLLLQHTVRCAVCGVRWRLRPDEGKQDSAAGIGFVKIPYNFPNIKGGNIQYYLKSKHETNVKQYLFLGSYFINKLGNVHRRLHSVLALNSLLYNSSTLTQAVGFLSVLATDLQPTVLRIS